MRLTDVQCRNSNPSEKSYKLSDGRVLFLLIHTNGSKYWRLKYRFAKKEKLLSLGVYPETSLSKARESAMVARELLADVVDPSEHKKSVKKVAEVINDDDSFESVALRVARQ